MLQARAESAAKAAAGAKVASREKERKKERKKERETEVVILHISIPMYYICMSIYSGRERDRWIDGLKVLFGLLGILELLWLLGLLNPSRSCIFVNSILGLLGL